VLAIALNLGFLHIIGLGAIVAAIALFACHRTFARRIAALLLTWSIHPFRRPPSIKTRPRVMQDKGHCHKGELEGVCRMLSADSKLNIPSRPHWLPLGVTKLCHKPSLPRKRRVRNPPSSENNPILQV
jgi:hypothetical protein